MRKIILTVLSAMVLVTAAGCGHCTKGIPKEAGFLAAAEYWYFYDEVTGENEKMRFSEDGSFYWGCECGEPIGASDVYELYEYDKESKIIRLYNDYDDCSMEMKVLDYSDYHLLMQIEGEVRGYTYHDIGMYIEESEKYLAGYNMYASIITGNSEEALIGPCDYDGDVEYPDNAKKTYTFADDVQFFDLNIRTVVKDNKETKEVSYTELTKEEGVRLLEDGTAFIWLNDEMQIEKMTFYGAVEIYE